MKRIFTLTKEAMEYRKGRLIIISRKKFKQFCPAVLEVGGLGCCEGNICYVFESDNGKDMTERTIIHETLHLRFGPYCKSSRFFVSKGAMMNNRELIQKTWEYVEKEAEKNKQVPAYLVACVYRLEQAINIGDELEERLKKTNRELGKKRTEVINLENQLKIKIRALENQAKEIRAQEKKKRKKQKEK